jgi:hypothetical protein
MKNIITILLMLISTVTFSQVTEQIIQWDVWQVTTIATAEIKDSADKIISYGSAKIEWQLSDGTQKIFNVIEPNGTWTNVTNQGWIVYEVEHEGQSGIISFKKDASGTMIMIRLMNDSESPAQWELTVNKTTIL